MKGKTLASLFIAGASLLYNQTQSRAGTYDSFEDGKIDSTQWVTNGRNGGIGGIGAGDWQSSFIENSDSDDGYLEARVFGPSSGNTFWGESSVQTVYDFNDGSHSISNFTWETNIGYQPHADIFSIQVTNGTPIATNNFTWPIGELPRGTFDLWHTSYHINGEIPKSPFPKTTWSIEIDPSGMASLYQSPDATGAPYSQIPLDLSEEWHLRFVEVDATSSGFGPGDNNFRLYDFHTVPEPAAIGLLGLGAFALCSQRKMERNKRK